MAAFSGEAFWDGYLRDLPRLMGLWRLVEEDALSHEIFTATYSGLGDRAEHAAPHVDLDTHIREISALLYEEDLTDVVLVGYSYGGW